MRYIGRRRSFWAVSVAVSALVLGSGALFSRLRAQETRTETAISPGLTLLSVATQSANGPLRFWLVKAEPKAWNLGLEVADASDVFKKRSVRNLAKQANATVAINGGFFAYGGAAVGAVKVKNEWHRLPWKTRTALSWDESNAQIGPLGGKCELEITRNDGTIQKIDAALNGFSLSGSHAPLTDGFAVLTRHFGAKWKRKSGEDALEFQNGNPIFRAQDEIPSEVAISETGFLLVARGAAAQTLSSIQSASWKVVLDTPGSDRFTQILGAGPRLVEKSLVKTTEVEESFRPDVVARGPRTAVGFDKDKNWLFLVADGRQAVSVGLTIPETAQLFHSLGAVEAMNLDGGSSTQLVINGELINTPSGYDPVNPLRPREVMVSNALVLNAR
ncbi:MAG TPA: phosphodiester glycosidase family protein [Abditibacterium sp.]|jgi:hypothetical protein